MTLLQRTKPDISNISNILVFKYHDEDKNTNLIKNEMNLNHTIRYNNAVRSTTKKLDLIQFYKIVK